MIGTCHIMRLRTPLTPSTLCQGIHVAPAAVSWCSSTVPLCFHDELRNSPMCLVPGYTLRCSVAECVCGLPIPFSHLMMGHTLLVGLGLRMDEVVQVDSAAAALSVGVLWLLGSLHAKGITGPQAGSKPCLQASAHITHSIPVRPCTSPLSPIPCHSSVRCDVLTFAHTQLGESEAAHVHEHISPFAVT